MQLKVITYQALHTHAHTYTHSLIFTMTIQDWNYCFTKEETAVQRSLTCPRPYRFYKIEMLAFKSRFIWL